MRKSFYLLLGLIFVAPSTFAQFSGGSGTANDPYQIASETDLANITGSYAQGGYYFLQTNNISLTGNWISIGEEDDPFYGFYDGDNYTIDGLFISYPTTHQRGLFGAIHPNAIVQNVGLINVSISDNRVGIGALVGYNFGTIINCYSTGTVTALNSSGGLVAISSGYISNSYSTVHITGGDYIGGFIGENFGSITNCYSTGNVDSEGNSARFGGFVGNNTGEITLSYSKGNLESRDRSLFGGGFVGYNNTGGHISNCYAWGSVFLSNAQVDENTAGGFVARNYSTITNSYSIGRPIGWTVGGFSARKSFAASSTNCFWDTETSTVSVSVSGTGKTTSEMQDINTYLNANWLFDCELWGLNFEFNNYYPYLLWQDENNDYEAEGCNHWKGYVNSDWENNNNWSVGIPTTGSNVVILSDGSSSNIPALDISETLKTVKVGPGADFSISPEGHLTITGTLEIDGVVKVNPGGKLTATGTIENNNGVTGLVLESDANGSASIIHSTANVPATVERYVTPASSVLFHLVSSPVSGQTISNFISDNTSVIAYSPSGGVYAMKPYRSDGTGWDSNYTGTETSEVVPGTTYSIGVKVGQGKLRFKGNLVNSTISKSLTDAGFAWNGIGNPYAAALNAKVGASSFLSLYGDQLRDSHYGLYIWNPQTSQYEIINGVPELSQDYVASGQGFIVKAVEGGGNVSFLTSMRAHQNPTFYKSSEKTEEWYKVIFQVVNASAKVLSNALVFNENMSKDLDVGYDAGLLTDNNSYKLFTRMPIEDSDLDLMVQALPNLWDETLVIPIGLVHTAGGEVTFSIASVNLPEGVKAVIEDRTLNIFTDLLIDDYAVTIPTEANSIGRFYLHVGTQITSVTDAVVDNFNFRIYPNPSKGEFFANISLEKPTYVDFQIYDISGRLVKNVQRNIYSEGTHSIHLNSGFLSSGIYIIKTKGYDLNNTLSFERAARIVVN